MTTCCRWNKGNLHISVTVQPKSSRNEVVGVVSESLKVKLTAPPVDGKANSALVKLLARQFHVPPSRVVIARGDRSRHKRIIVTDPQVMPNWAQDAS